MPQKSGVRLIRAINAKGRKGAGIVYSDTTSQGTELLLPLIDAQTAKVSWEKVSGKYGKNFVEIDEDDSQLGKEETEAFNRKPEETLDTDTDEMVQTNAGETPTFTAQESDEERRKREKRERKDKD